MTRVAERHAAVMAGLDSAELRERAADIRQVGRMVADELAGRVPPVPPDGAFVLLAEEVTAPDLLTYAGRLAGAVSVLGGAGSHASIIARSLGVPLLVGVAAAALEAADGVPLLVDGDGGTLVVEPGDAAAAVVPDPDADPHRRRAHRGPRAAGPDARRRRRVAAGQHRLQHRGPPGPGRRRGGRRPAAHRAGVPRRRRLADRGPARGGAAPGAGGAAGPPGDRAAAGLHQRQDPAVPRRDPRVVVAGPAAGERRRAGRPAASPARRRPRYRAAGAGADGHRRRRS